MNTGTKISPAFEPFLSDSGPNDKRDAIVVYQAPTAEGPPVRGRLRALKQRLDYVKARATAQAPVQAKLFETYQKVASRQLPGSQQLAVSTIGANTLPVGWVEVTRKTLPTIAEQPNVVAVLPNQKIHSSVLKKSTIRSWLGKRRERS